MASMLHSLLSEKPKVPQFKKVDFGAETEDMLAENQENLPAAAAFAEEFNRLSGDQLNAALERMLPGYANLRDQTTGNINSMLSGKLPTDVENRIERYAAERGINTGTAGSDFGEHAAVRNLGLTSLQLSQQGLDSAMRWIESSASRTPTYNMASSFVPIQQRVGIRASENQFQFQRDWLKNKVDAIPEGWEAALITLADNIEEIGSSILSSYAGGAVGGMGGGGGGGGSSAPPVSDGWQGMNAAPASIPAAPAQPSYYGGMSLNGAGAAWGSPNSGGGSGVPANSFDAWWQSNGGF